MLAIDMSVALQLVQILPDRRFRHPDHHSEARTRAAFFLEPVQDLHAARLDKPPVEIAMLLARDC